MNYDINSLNEEQLAPLKQIDGAVLVTAGAGSGKTRLLTHRVAYLIEHEGVSPFNILAITFTNKAAGEMKERISNMVVGADRVWISTFHSMCAKILRMDIEHLPPFTKDFSIYSESDSDKVIKEVLGERGISDDKIKKELVYHISNWKNNGQSYVDYIKTHESEYDIQKIGSMMLAYNEKLAKNNALDFDDLLVKTVELFTKNPDVLDKYARRFEYILVDEFQDTNLVQYNLVKMLASVHKNVFAVGDEDQCIYSWRGANFQNIFNFKKDFEGAKTFKLERNYRSTNEIISVANNVIKHNSSRLDKNMWTDKNGGEKPTLYNAYDERDEALYVAKTISTLKSEGYDYNDIAVLMRMNALSRSIEEALLSYNIPHRIFGGFKFYERAEIKNIIAYLRLFVNPKDDISFSRIINFPKRGIGDGTLAKLGEINRNSSLLENCIGEEIKSSALYKKFQPFAEAFNRVKFKPQKPLSAFVEEVLNEFNVRASYNPSLEEEMDKIMNIDQFVASVKEFEALNPDAGLGEYLENITLSSENDEIGQGGAVTIATVHAVKGLEFKVVFVIGLEEGIFPIKRATSSTDIEEERRLMYVALTRAEERLYLSHASKRYMYCESQYQSPSRFCKELGLLGIERKENRSYTYDGYSRSQNGYIGKAKFQKVYNFEENGDNFNDFNDFSAPKPLFNKNLVLKNEAKDEKPKQDVSRYKVGMRVFYQKFGEGKIVEISDDGLVGDIIFDDFGKKSLMLETAKLDILS